MTTPDAEPGTSAARCIVCGSTSDDIVLQENGYEGRACTCGTIYMSPVPPESVIDPTAVGHSDAFYDLPVDLKARWIRRRVGGRSLLEIGCGTGAFLAAARRLGFAVEGIEPSIGRARIAEAIAGARVHPVLLEDFRSRGARYDVVYHSDMLAHFADPRAALRQMTALLAPGGVLAFEVGLLGGIPRFWYRHMRDISYPEHRWFYSRASLVSLLRDCDLIVTHATRFDLSLCVLLTRSIRSLAALRTRARRRAVSVTPPLAPVNTRARASLAERPTYNAIQNFLRYRAGWLLPPVGPGTQFVIARPR